MMARHARRGMSLLEVMIALAILVLVLGATYTILAGGTRTYASSTSLTNIQEQGRRVLDEMAGELRDADLTGLTITAGTIRFKKNVGFAGGVPTWGPYITYSLQNSPVDANGNGTADDRLVQRQEGAQIRVLTHYVRANGLAFTQNGRNVLIRLTLNSTDSRGKLLQTFVESSVTLRNESGVP